MHISSYTRTRCLLFVVCCLLPASTRFSAPLMRLLPASSHHSQSIHKNNIKISHDTRQSEEYFCYSKSWRTTDSIGFLGVYSFSLSGTQWAQILDEWGSKHQSYQSPLPCPRNWCKLLKKYYPCTRKHHRPCDRLMPSPEQRLHYLTLPGSHMQGVRTHSEVPRYMFGLVAFSWRPLISILVAVPNRPSGCTDNLNAERSPRSAGTSNSARVSMLF